MNNALGKHIITACEKLHKHFKDLEKRKAILLMESLMHFKGNDNLIKELDEKGLPKTIFVSSGIAPEVVKSLSFFAHVVTHPAIKDPGIVFSWTSIGSLPDQPELLENALNGI